MNLETFLSGVTEKNKEETVKLLIEKSSPTFDFFVMVVLSVSMATFGFLLGSEAIIIGSMLIAPLLYPVLSLSLGFVTSNTNVISGSLKTIFKALVISVAISFFLTFFFGQGIELETVLQTRFAPSFLYVFVAIIAGLAGAYSLVKPMLNAALPGVVIAVALIPPLSVIGIGIARFDMVLIANSFSVLLMNFAGIVLSNMIVFSLLNFYTKKSTTHNEFEKNQEEINGNEKLKEAQKA